MDVNTPNGAEKGTSRPYKWRVTKTNLLLNTAAIGTPA
jgi:hypothetical protein